MSIKLIPSIVVGLAIGFGLGCLPVVNEYLHWNLWYIVPISGLILGVLIAWIQFAICYRINQKVAGASLVVLAVAVMVAYAAVDYGIYFTMKFTISGVQGVPDGEYRLRELMTFTQFMKLKLQGSAVSDGPGDVGTEIGATGMTISYIADLLGGLLGAGGMLYYCSEKRPYCNRCGKYKQEQDKYQIFFEHEDNLVKEIFGSLADLKEKGIYDDMASYCRELAEQHQTAEGDVKIVVEQRICPDCREATILGSVFRYGKKEWKEVGELAFSLNSEHHEEPPFGRHIA
ncbi:MAG TPA: hypothetical protein VMX13_13015 [Sedimentisphaerales bacterium]|nr:hypothetical protein [Sedimentisphaerales bacterium]